MNINELNNTFIHIIKNVKIDFKEYENKNDKLDYLEILIHNGVNIKGDDLNYKDMYGNTILLYATIGGYLNVVKYLVKHGANLNHIGFNDYTAFKLSIKYKHFEIVKYLNEQGAYISEEDKLLTASNSNNFTIFKYLIKKGININLQFTTSSYSALMIASMHGYTEIVKYLVESHANLNLQSHNGFTALMYAVVNDKIEIVKYLVEQGANIFIENNLKNKTAYLVAKHFGKKEIAIFLKEKMDLISGSI